MVRATTLDVRFSIRALEREGGAMKGWIVGLAAVMILSWAADAKAGIIFDGFDDGNTDGWTFREFDPRGPGEWSVQNLVLVNRV